MNRVQIERTWGVHIADDYYYNPIKCKLVKAYRIYSADGCQWENGLKNLKAVEKECRKYDLELKSIKRTEETRRAKA